MSTNNSENNVALNVNPTCDYSDSQFSNGCFKVNRTLTINDISDLTTTHEVRDVNENKRVGWLVKRPDGTYIVLSRKRRFICSGATGLQALYIIGHRLSNLNLRQLRDARRFNGTLVANPRSEMALADRGLVEQLGGEDVQGLKVTAPGAELVSNLFLSETE